MHVVVEMARRHRCKVEAYEVKLQAMMRERQAAFEAGFQEDLQYYKQYGQTESRCPEKLRNRLYWIQSGL